MEKKEEEKMTRIKFYLNPHRCERKPDTPAYPCWSSVNEFSLILTHPHFLNKTCGKLKKGREMRSQLAPTKTKVHKELRLDRPDRLGLAAPRCTSLECARIFIQVRPEFSQLCPVQVSPSASPYWLLSVVPNTGYQRTTILTSSHSCFPHPND